MFEKIHDQLDSVCVHGLTRCQTEALVGELARVEAHAHERMLAAMAAIDSLGDGGIDSDGVIRARAHASAREAKKARAAATQLVDMPTTRRKLAAGEIGAEHVEAVAAAAVRVDDPTAADAALAATASAMPADLFAKRCREWAARHEPHDTSLQRHLGQRKARNARLWTDDEGMTAFAGAVDPVSGAELRARWDEEVDRLWRADGGRDGSPDVVRTPDQRRADALMNLLVGTSGTDTPPDDVHAHASPSPARARTSRPAAHPKHRGLVVFDAGRLDGGEGRADVVGGGPLPQPVLERLLCDAEIAPLVVDTEGRPLWLGRTVRTATPDQWEAMIARDGGCFCCGAEPSRCEAHHLTFWDDLGSTDVDTMLLVCSRTHHLVHDHGYTIRRHDGAWILEPPSHPRPPPGRLGRR